MSDANDSQTPNEQYSSQVDSAFAAAWNDVFNPSNEEEATPSGDSAETPPSGDSAPTPPVEGAGADAGAVGAPDGGATPDVRDLAGEQPAGEGEAAAGAEQAPAAGPDPGAVQDPAAPDVTTVAPAFATASEQITERMQKSFEQSAMNDIREKVDPKYLDALRPHPMALVGEQVPALKPNGQPIMIRDSREAKDYQEAVQHMLDSQLDDAVRTKMDEVRPLMNVIQESILLFQNNTDLVPNTKQFDRELADRVSEITKNYELRVNGKLYGYQVNVQPLINSIRTQLSKERGAAGVAQQQVQQRQATEQPRNQAGQFESPQAGITSKAGMSGASESDDWSGFWNAVGMPNLNV